MSETTAETIKIPRRSGAGRIERVAVYEDEAADDELPAQLRDVTRLPADVAVEIGLEHGQALRVTQRTITHLDDGRLIKKTLQEGEMSDASTGYVESMELLQVVIDETVESSNFGIHTDAADRILVKDMDTSGFAWWLFSWLGVKEMMERVRGASDGPLAVGRRPSPGGKNGT